MARKISNLSVSYIRDSDWLNFIHFSGYKFKIRLVSILRKREDHALISISPILKFSAQNSNLKYLRFTTLGYKDIGIRKTDFVAKTQFL